MKIPPEVVSKMESVFMDLVANPSNEKLVGGGFYKRDTAASYKKVLSMLKDTSRIGWRESLNAALRWQNEDCIEAIKKIRVPVVSINSDRQPTNVETFRKYVPTFEVKIIPDVGHVVMWDAPEDFNHLFEESIQEFVSN
jgi:pimeloyl-ACP methyl ester carboxylesterase